MLNFKSILALFRRPSTASIIPSCKFTQKLTHPKREVETSLGNLIADAFAEVAECDVMLVGSGSIRTKEMGPLVTLRDLLSCFPFDDVLYRYTINGTKIKKIFSHIMRQENRNSEGKCYQVNSKARAIYSDAQHKLASLTINSNQVSNTMLYRICLQGYHANNAASYLNISQKELLESGETKVVSTSAKEVLEEHLRNHQNIKRRDEGRFVYR
jgi:5'-nucleotidase/UDP-sugar diphosphatase